MGDDKAGFGLKPDVQGDVTSTRESARSSQFRVCARRDDGVPVAAVRPEERARQGL